MNGRKQSETGLAFIAAKLPPLSFSPRFSSKINRYSLRFPRAALTQRERDYKSECNEKQNIGLGAFIFYR